ncbi:ABC transporter ATP-binding protein [Nonomuraea longicatena]|uniref:ABC transporter ATP-binding protein n=1 Tax=Nonomuraea longicatena TaxID=83682 RepID=A0ABP3ZD28_9ACTN
MTLLRVENLRARFGPGKEVVSGLSLEISAGQCVALVGESGSGKSVTARALLGLSGAEVDSTRFEVGGRDARAFTERDWRAVRGRFAGLVLQDALGSLDPLRTVGAEIAETLRIAGRVPRSRRAEEAVRLLTAVGVPEPRTRAAQYPHQLSGGLRQRALIASAVAADPPLLIADEPTTALDATVQAQILRLLAARTAQGGALLLISHDLAVVAALADHVLVMREGRVVEQGPADRLLTDPRHPYTRALLDAVPSGRAARPAVPSAAAPVLSATGLGHSYGSRHAVRDVSLTLRGGETLGVVGESGSGKTTLARLLLGLLEPATGQVLLHGQPWSGLPEKARRRRCHRIQVVSQHPLGSFDPRYTVARVVGEPLPAAGREQAVLDLLARVGLGPEHAARHPRELSGGQRQRVAIARALGPRPDVLVCDEPVSALDVVIQAQVLDLLARLKQEDGTALVFVSHDLGVIRRISDRVLVMKDGRVVEEGDAEEVFLFPSHPYTRELLSATTARGPRAREARG